MLRAEPLWSFRRARLAAALALIGVWGWPVLGGPSEAAFRAAANAALGNLMFGQGGHVAFRAADRPRKLTAYDDDVSWSTRLELRIDDLNDRDSVLINPRRLWYLPCVLLGALVLASPLTARRKALALGTGFTLLCGAALLSVWLAAAWLFAHELGHVYQLSALQQQLLDFGYEAWATALGNRYITPILLAVALVLPLSRGVPPVQASTKKARVTPGQKKKSRVRRSRRG